MNILLEKEMRRKWRKKTGRKKESEIEEITEQL